MVKNVCLVVGDGGVGKTSLIISHTTNKYPRDYVPCMADNQTVTKMIEDEPYTLSLLDTHNDERYCRWTIRDFSSMTAVFLVCFSVVSPESFESKKNGFRKLASTVLKLHSYWSGHKLI